MKLIKGKAYCFIDNHDDYHFYVFNEGDEIKATFTEFEHDPSDGTDREIGDVEFDAYQISILHRYHQYHWYFIEDCTSSKSEIYDEILKAETATEAFIEASRKWNALTESDRSKRDEAYIGYADTDDDGCVDYDTMTDIYWFKRDGSAVYYILDDENGYGSEYPYCSDAVETAELLEGWNYDSDDPLPDYWHVASRVEIEYSGTYDGTTGTSHPGTRETEDEEA